MLARSQTLPVRAPNKSPADKSPTIRPAHRKAMRGLSAQALRAFRAVYQETRRDLLGHLREACTCRSCGRPANPCWRFCKHCGAGHPIRVHISPSVVVTTVSCEVSIVLLQFI